jgi:hypothetical protein
MKDIIWFGARTVYRVEESNTVTNAQNKLYEERVVLVSANSFDDAIEKAEKDAEKYAANNNMTYLGFVNVYELYANKIEEGTEVYSLMRESELDADAYIDRFFDTGNERTK